MQGQLGFTKVQLENFYIASYRAITRKRFRFQPYLALQSLKVKPTNCKDSLEGWRNYSIREGLDLMS